MLSWPYASGFSGCMMIFNEQVMNRGLFFLKCAVIGVLCVALVGWITMLLWNWLVPDLFNGPAISYWQALGLLLLSKILFWGFGGKRHHMSTRHSPYWKHRFYEKFSNMSADQREEFKRRMKEKWCRFDGGASDEKSGPSNV
jgi:hypothetical protein